MNKGKRQKSWKRLVAAILIAAFTATSIPWDGETAQAQEIQEAQETKQDALQENAGTDAAGEMQPEEEGPFVRGGRKVRGEHGDIHNL